MNLSSRIITILAFFAFTGSCSNDSFVVFLKADFERISIENESDYPVGFSILSDSLVAIGTGKRIVIYDTSLKLRKTILCHDFITHFDLDEKGNGFVATNEELHRIKEFSIPEERLQPKFSMKGSSSGMFRIDMSTEDSVRFVSLSPDFVIRVPLDGVEKDIRRENRALIDSLLIARITEYAGKWKDYHIFFSPSPSSTSSQTIYSGLALKVDSVGNIVDEKKCTIKGADLGWFIQLSYPCRSYPDGTLYVMFQKDNNCRIIKFAIERLFGI